MKYNFQPRTGCLFIFTVVLLAAFICEAEPKTKTFNDLGNGFSITLSDDWERLPDDKLAALNDQVAQIHPDWKRPVFQHWYQRKESPAFAFPPFIWIRVMELDREPTPEFIRSEMIRDKNQEPGVTTNDPVFDSESGAFFADNELNFEGLEPAKGAMAFFPTRKSLIKVFCFAAQSDAEKDSQLLRQMFSGVRIYDDYKTGGVKRSPTGLIVSIVAIGIMVLVLCKSKPAKSHSEELPLGPPSAS